MLVKEFRIPVPVTLEEYKIAQLYMIQKRSLKETNGPNTGVEILIDQPFENKEMGKGQYTKKIYHIGTHIPSWIKSILPKSAFIVEEEAWNCYPITKTITTCPFVSKLSVEMITHYFPDSGSRDDVFPLKKNEERLPADFVNIVVDNYPSSYYLESEDPLLFVSKKASRGPLTKNWLNELVFNKNNEPIIMCSYKLIKVNFNYIGIQKRVEQYILDAIREQLVVGHRQAYAWIDEWIDLNIDDIRKLEAEAALKMNANFVKTNDFEQFFNAK